MFQKIVNILFCLIIVFFLSSNSVFAEDKFKTSIEVTYKVNESGITTITNRVTLENLYTDFYATAYTLSLDNIKAGNINAYEEGKKLPVETTINDTKTNIVITFTNSVVGRGNKRTFNITYDDFSIAQRTGEVWEISIPRLSSDSDFYSYDISLVVPNSFGEEAYISPNPGRKELKDDYKIYSFNKNIISKTGIMAGFGEFQVFSFNMTYHLENPLIKFATIDIALPPDTSLQKVYYSSLDPKPDNIKVDLDGNWLARYTLTPRQRVDIKLEGSVQIFSFPRQFFVPSDEVLSRNLKSSEFWQKDDYAIIELANKYNTPKEIYDFVVNYLNYDITRVKPNLDRFGALQALKNPDSAICMEYTDLFIAIARAANIPAREINGFAYTENPKIQPLSLVSDVLHSWPEYWDKNKKTWVAIDPTWGSTTGGIDFFNKLDLRHFTFVIHGEDPQKPYPPGSYKLGPNPQKDVYVNFGQLPKERTPKIKISAKIEKFIPFVSQKMHIKLENIGTTADYNLISKVFFDFKEANSENISVITPYAKSEYDIKIPFSFLGRKTPHIIKIEAGGESLEIKGAKTEVIIYNLASIFLITLIFTLGILIKLGKIKIPNIKKVFTRKPRNI